MSRRTDEQGRRGPHGEAGRPSRLASSLAKTIEPGNREDQGEDKGFKPAASKCTRSAHLDMGQRRTKGRCNRSG